MHYNTNNDILQKYNRLQRQRSVGNTATNLTDPQIKPKLPVQNRIHEYC